VSVDFRFPLVAYLRLFEAQRVGMTKVTESSLALKHTGSRMVDSVRFSTDSLAMVARVAMGAFVAIGPLGKVKVNVGPS